MLVHTVNLSEEARRVEILGPRCEVMTLVQRVEEAYGQGNVYPIDQELSRGKGWDELYLRLVVKRPE